jgi:hypothetical protein
MEISRRTLLAAAAIPLTGVASACAKQQRTARLYVTPEGGGDGSSWENGASLRTLDDLLRATAPGGEILVAADRGEYAVADAIELSAGGRAGGVVRVRGVNAADGEPMPALIRGARAGSEMGGEAFRLLRGANHLHFSHFDFRAVGNGCFRVGGPTTGLTIEDCAFDDVYRFFENTASDNENQASLRGFAIRRCRGTRAERGFLRIRYSARDGVVEDCAAQGLANEGGHIPAGCALDDRAANITYRRCVMENFQQWRGGDYWNGDGFSDEEQNAGIRYEACEARGSTDGGFDCKSRDVVLQDCVAEDNKRNFRLWSAHATLTGCSSRNPNFRGRDAAENATACHIWIGGEDGARVEIAGLTVADQDATAIFEFEHDDSRAEIRGVTVESPRRNWNASVQESAGLIVARQD